VSEADISFGDLEEAQPREELRPDENRHFCVASVHNVQAKDLPIYVDIDVMRDMEVHALSDTRVELGGVMLGGQYVDREGNPFVVVTDSLRAEHYEATKGSFKFTHETWEQISRQRDEFPEDVEMVGWYHTHPSWGVFLSGMDDFICQNFFNRPLDLALVIDPESGDRGMFQWTEGGVRKTRRTGGFYLIASRYRAEEVADFAQQLGGKLDMPYERSTTSGSSTVVNVADPQPTWMPLTVVGMLGVQMLFLMLIAWKILFPGGPTEEEAKVAARVEQLEQRQEVENREALVNARADILDDVVANMGGGGADVVTRLTNAELERNHQQAAVAAFATKLNELENDLSRQEKKLKSAEKTAKDTKADFEKKLKKMETTAETAAAENEELIAKLKSALKEHDPKHALLAKPSKKDAAATEPSKYSLTNPWVITAVLIVLVVAIGSTWAFISTRPPFDEALLDDDANMFRVTEHTSGSQRPTVEFPEPSQNTEAQKTASDSAPQTGEDKPETTESKEDSSQLKNPSHNPRTNPSE
jgi:proteasome lid subunit RPN8/RPN11